MTIIRNVLTDSARIQAYKSGRAVIDTNTWQGHDLAWALVPGKTSGRSSSLPSDFDATAHHTDLRRVNPGAFSSYDHPRYGWTQSVYLELDSSLRGPASAPATSVPEFTVSFWFLRGQATTGIGRILTQSNTHIRNQWYTQKDSSEKLAVGINQAAPTSPEDWIGIFSTSTLIVGTYYYAVMTFDGTNIRIYIDGALESTSSAATGYASADAGEVNFGRMTFGGSSDAHNYGGVVEDARFYTRVLSLAEIQEIYLRPQLLYKPRPHVPAYFLSFVTDITIQIGTATESDVASSLTVVHPKIIPVTSASEVDAASVLTAVHPRVIAVTAATEADVSSPLSIISAGQIGTATETDVAQPLTVVHPKVVQVGVAAETDVSQQLTFVHTIQLGVATELDVAQQLLGMPVEIVIGVAAETDVAQVISEKPPLPPVVGAKVCLSGSKASPSLQGSVETVVSLSGSFRESCEE